MQKEMFIIFNWRLFIHHTRRIFDELENLTGYVVHSKLCIVFRSTRTETTNGLNFNLVSGFNCPCTQRHLTKIWLRQIFQFVTGLHIITAFFRELLCGCRLQDEVLNVSILGCNILIRNFTFFLCSFNSVATYPFNAFTLGKFSRSRCSLCTV